jgi:hypothetical protein
MLSLWFVCLLLLSPLAFADVPQSKPGASYPNASWALGVVVPEGSGLADGGGVHWESVSNVTAVASLPNITLPDRVVYAVLSVMTSDGGVMQAAAGIYPNRTEWLAYSWVIPNANTVPPVYQWVLNGSTPTMSGNARISMSIFRASALWSVSMKDEDTGSSVLRTFPPAMARPLMAGDQEVFALESYSRSSTVFSSMGSLTLEALLVDSLKVTNGFYSYGDWDPNHTPLFAVGSSGTAPPGFISLEPAGPGSFVWGFSGLWQGTGSGYETPALGVAFVAAALAIVAAAAIAITRTRRHL